MQLYGILTGTQDLQPGHLRAGVCRLGCSGLQLGHLINPSSMPHAAASDQQQQPPLLF